MLDTYLNELKNTDYIKKYDDFEIYFIHEWAEDEMVFRLCDMDKQMKILKGLICEKKSEVQYPIGKIDFSNCKTKDDVKKKIYEYINKVKEAKKIFYEENQKKNNDNGKDLVC